MLHVQEGIKQIQDNRSVNISEAGALEDTSLLSPLTQGLGAVGHEGMDRKAATGVMSSP